MEEKYAKKRRANAVQYRHRLGMFPMRNSNERVEVEVVIAVAVVEGTLIEEKHTVPLISRYAKKG